MRKRGAEMSAHINIRRLVVALSAAALVLAFASVSFGQAVTTQSASALGNKDIEKAETAVGDLVADAVRAFAKADIAFIAASELKAKDQPIPAGKVSASDLGDLVSYTDDPLAVLKLSGAQIRQALEKAVLIYPQPNLGFLQVSGMKFTFLKDGAGSRVTSITINGSAMDDSRTYTVALSNSMANGALGYWKVWSKANVLRQYPDASLVKAISDYLAANPKIDYSALNRISVK